MLLERYELATNKFTYRRWTILNHFGAFADRFLGPYRVGWNPRPALWVPDIDGVHPQSLRHRCWYTVGPMGMKSSMVP